MPNSFSYLILLAWPLLSFAFYKKYGSLQGSLVTIVGGALLLPVNVSFDLEGFPSFGKMEICALSALALCKLKTSEMISLVPKAGPERYFVLLMIIAPVITALTNSEAVYRGNHFFPGLSFYHGLSDAFSMYIFIVPFILGLQLVRTYKHQVILFKFMVAAGLWYSLLILIETRFSPQLHTWLYGFFPHSFLQQKRFGGFRAVVFLGHGLVVAMFVVVVLSSSVILWKEKIKASRFSPIVVVFYLVLVLIFCKSVGPGILGLMFAITVGFGSIGLLRGVTAGTTIIVVAYPILCLYGLFPHDFLVNIFYPFDVSKSGSLAFRFYHESQLLELAVQKPIFGWGSWGRNRLVDSVTDGYWVVIFGKYGIAGFVSIFGLMTFSIMRALRSSVAISTLSEQRILIGHAFLVAIIMVDQIPNSSLSRGWMWFLVGALLARANTSRVDHAKRYKQC